MTRVAALTQAAVFDAVNGIDRRYTPVHVTPAGPADASRRAATMQAAFVIMAKFYGAGGVFTPNQQATLDARRTAALVDIGAHESAGSIAAGVAWGQWRPTPNDPYPGTSSNGVGYPQFSSQVTWAIDSPSQFRSLVPGPPALGSAQYATEFNETKSKGSQMSTTRTPDETLYSWFWNTGTGTYLWNNVALELLDRREDDARDDALGFFDWDQQGHHHRDRLLENARVLATLDVAMADAGIGCWDAKYSTRPGDRSRLSAARRTTAMTQRFRISCGSRFSRRPGIRSVHPGTRA